MLSTYRALIPIALSPILLIGACATTTERLGLPPLTTVERVVDTTTNAKLEASFFGPFWGACWIIDLGEDYEFAVEGHPSRDYLWILSRAPVMDEAVYGGILERLEAKDCQLDRLQTTLQPPE